QYAFVEGGIGAQSWHRGRRLRRDESPGQAHQAAGYPRGDGPGSTIPGGARKFLHHRRCASCRWRRRDELTTNGSDLPVVSITTTLETNMKGNRRWMSACSILALCMASGVAAAGQDYP